MPGLILKNDSNSKNPDYFKLVHVILLSEKLEMQSASSLAQPGNKTCSNNVVPLIQYPVSFSFICSHFVHDIALRYDVKLHTTTIDFFHV